MNGVQIPVRTKLATRLMGPVWSVVRIAGQEHSVTPNVRYPAYHVNKQIMPFVSYVQMDRPAQTVKRARLLTPFYQHFYVYPLLFMVFLNKLSSY